MKLFRVERYGKEDYEIEADRFDVSSRGTLTFVVDGPTRGDLVIYAPAIGIAALAKGWWQTVAEVKETE